MRFTKEHLLLIDRRGRVQWRDMREGPVYEGWLDEVPLARGDEKLAAFWKQAAEVVEEVVPMAVPADTVLAWAEHVRGEAPRVMVSIWVLTETPIGRKRWGLTRKEASAEVKALVLEMMRKLREVGLFVTVSPFGNLDKVSVVARSLRQVRLAAEIMGRYAMDPRMAPFVASFP